MSKKGEKEWWKRQDILCEEWKVKLWEWPTISSIQWNSRGTLSADLDEFRMSDYEKIKNARQFEITNMCKDCIEEYINDYFSRLPKSESTEILKKEMLYMYKRRFNKNVWLRPFVVSTVADYFAKKDISKDIILAITAAEVFNISTYQTNLLFDDKINDSNISWINQVSVSMISMSIANKMIQDLNCKPWKKLELLNLLNKNNWEVYVWQNIDLNTLLIKNADRILNMWETEYLKEYRERCDYMWWTTVENCAAWWYILWSENIDTEKLDKLKLLFRKRWWIMQKINDLSDFVVFSGENKDLARYTDVRAWKITLPFYYILKSLNEEERQECLDNIKNWDKWYLDSFFQKYLYKNSDVIKKVLAVIMEEWDECKKLIKDLWLEAKHFQFMYNNIFFTKFTREFFDRKLLKEVKKDLKKR